MGAKLIQQVGTLFADFNKNKNDTGKYEDGVVGEQEQVLTLDIEDDELIKLSDGWVSEFGRYQSKITERQEQNYNYWKGEESALKTADLRGTDNIIFESVETLLPLLSRQNPEPWVKADESEEGIFVADSTAKILAEIADESRLKIKIKKAARHWMLFFLGAFKMGWDSKRNNMFFQVVHPKNLVLDPKGEFDGAEFTGRYIGEFKTAPASELAAMFPEHAETITQGVNEKMGTVLGYHEWWTNEYMFWRFKSIILEKRANPYWNEGAEKIVVDKFGNKTVEQGMGANHFVSPKMPFAFLTVFNTGEQPHDETSLIEQVIPLQDIVNKRIRQIDKNADDTNNGWVFNNQFTKETANSALKALRDGGAIIAPTVSITESVERMVAPPLAGDVYNDLVDKREQIRNIMGVRGSSASGIMQERTVRGKIEIKGQDVDRLSLIVEHIEQLVDHIYNLAVQTMYVYYGPEQAIAYLGLEEGQQYMAMLRGNPDRRLVVSVKEGSMIPQDPMMRRNEAIDLFSQGAMDLETLYERLDFPNPKEAAKKALLYKLDPGALLQPEAAQEQMLQPMSLPAPIQ